MSKERENQAITNLQKISKHPLVPSFMKEDLHLILTRFVEMREQLESTNPLQ